MNAVSFTVSAALLGNSFEFTKGPLTFTIEFEENKAKFSAIEKGDNGDINLKGLLLIPPLANMHVHALDYSIVDEGWYLDIDSVVGEPYGLKYVLLKKKKKKELCNSLRSFIKEAQSYGVGFIAEFRELGLRGLKICNSSSSGKGHFILSMPQSSEKINASYLESLSALSKGFGISSPLYFSQDQLKLIFKIAAQKHKLVHSHISEIKETHDESDLKLLLKSGKPNAVVHGTWLNEEEIALLAEKSINLILCLRSNLWFISGIPNVKDIYNTGVSVSLGTDNAGWIKPDLWREAELLYIFLRKAGINDPQWILKALFNASPIGVNNFITEGKEASFTLLNYYETPLATARNKAVALIKRADREYVKSVVIEGEPLYCQNTKVKTLCNSLRNHVG